MKLSLIAATMLLTACEATTYHPPTEGVYNVQKHLKHTNCTAAINNSTTFAIVNNNNGTETIQFGDYKGFCIGRLIDDSLIDSCILDDNQGAAQINIHFTSAGFNGTIAVSMNDCSTEYELYGEKQ